MLKVFPPKSLRSLIGRRSHLQIDGFDTVERLVILADAKFMLPHKPDRVGIGQQARLLGGGLENWHRVRRGCSHRASPTARRCRPGFSNAPGRAESPVFPNYATRGLPYFLVWGGAPAVGAILKISAVFSFLFAFPDWVLWIEELQWSADAVSNWWLARPEAGAA